MPKNDFYLTYKYTGNTVKVLVRNEKNTTIVTEKGEIDTYNSGVYFEVDIYDALRMSVGRPWSLDRIKFIITSVEEQKDHIIFDMYNDTIKVIVDVMLTPSHDLLFDCKWENVSQDVLKDVMLGVAIPSQSHHNLKVIIPPSVNMYGVDEKGALSGEHIEHGGYVAEEHRLTLPVVSIANMKHSACTNMAIFALPSRFKANALFDNEWSLGFTKQDKTFYMLLLSGVVMYQGQKDKILADTNSIVEYDRGYFDLAPGESVSKKFFVSGWRDSRDTNEITNLLDKCYSIYRPKGLNSISIDEYIKYKRTALANRYYENEVSVGYSRQLLLDDEQNVYYGEPDKIWSIDNLRAAWCDAAASLVNGNRNGIQRAKKCVEFFVSAFPATKKNLRNLYFNTQSETWSGSRTGDVIYSDDFGRMLCYLADIILLFRQYFLDIPAEWINVLTEGCNFLCTKRKLNKTGLYPEFWNADGSIGSKEKSSSGMTCISALARAYKVTLNSKYIRASSNALLKYYDAIIEKNTMFYEKKKFYEIRDCNKVSYANFLIAAMDCYASTEDDRFLKAALASTEWLTLYVNVIGYPFKSGSPFDNINFGTVGSSVVSATEQCCDVRFPYYELQILADETDNALVKKVQEITYAYALQQFATEGIDYGYLANGEQPRYIYTTNWSHEYNVDEWRGGCNDINDLATLCWNLKQAISLNFRNRNKQKEY